MLFFLAVKEPGLRDRILTLLGLRGTLGVQYYFRKGPGGVSRDPAPAWLLKEIGYLKSWVVRLLLKSF
ncbi:MAG: hypothetical protein KJ624_03410 [Chloroflexi bacterium]|nr:hypothetical protein [Chloroflexota bacterium]